MYRLNVAVKFEASHQLKHMPEGHKCGRVHGHSYEVEISVASTVLEPDTGMIIDSGLIKNRIRERLDHKHLNDVFEGMGVEKNTTAENLSEQIALWVQALLDEYAPHGSVVVRIAVRETDSSYAEFLPDPGPIFINTDLFKEVKPGPMVWLPKEDE